MIEIKHLLEEKLYNDDFFKNHCYIVGGFVRDIVMGISPKDIDIVVDVEHGAHKLALKIYNELKDIISKPRKMSNYPIWQLTFIDGKYKGYDIEIADTMSEEYPDKYSRQRLVKYASLEQDILRRDFTINSLLMKFCCGDGIESIIDISNFGINDIKKNHLIRCIPNINADEIFYVDPLRILRAIRFSIKYNWKIDKNTYESMKRVKDRINILSIERIISELEKISNYSYGIYRAIKIFDDIDILKYIFPEISELKKMPQAPDGRNIHMEGSIYKCKNFISNE